MATRTHQTNLLKYLIYITFSEMMARAESVWAWRSLGA